MSEIIDLENFKRANCSDECDCEESYYEPDYEALDAGLDMAAKWIFEEDTEHKNFMVAIEAIYLCRAMLNQDSYGSSDEAILDFLDRIDHAVGNVQRMVEDDSLHKRALRYCPDFRKSVPLKYKIPPVRAIIIFQHRIKRCYYPAALRWLRSKIDKQLAKPSFDPELFN